ncbi:MAG: hypothetical protein HN341_10295 [Verrucomicrobia bacterium]|nr:hypothetical protein [Verrucomicrobiota bacterium]
MCRVLRVIVVGVLLAGGVSLADGDVDVASFREEQLARAALNYERAAIVQRQLAEELLNRSRTLQVAAYTTEEELRERLLLSGDYDKKAAVLAAGAAADFDKAVDIWRSALRSSRSEHDSGNVVSDVRSKATETYQLAISLYERAADAYASTQSYKQETAMRQKAGGLLVLLAKRGP